MARRAICHLRLEAMPKQVARVGDGVRYVCRRGKHTFQGIGRITRGSRNDFVDGKAMALDGGACNCGPCGIGIIRATAVHHGNGRKIARIGDLVRIVAGRAKIIRASVKTRAR